MPAMEWALYDPLGRRVAGGTAQAASSDESGAVAYDVSSDLSAGDRRPTAGIYYLQARAGYRVARRTIVVMTP